MGRPTWVFAVALATAPVACSSASPAAIGRAGSLPPSTSTTSTTTVESPTTPVRLTVSSFDLHGPGRPADAVERVKVAVVRTLDRYLEDGVLAPLRSGGPAGDLTALFTARAGEHLAATGDRKAFVDEGLPPAPRIVALSSAVRLAALAGPAGNVELVSAQLDLKLAAGGQAATVTIDRDAELTLVAVGDDWRIDSYWVRVSRDTPDTSDTVVVGQ